MSRTPRASYTETLPPAAFPPILHCVTALSANILSLRSVTPSNTDESVSYTPDTIPLPCKATLGTQQLTVKLLSSKRSSKGNILREGAGRGRYQLNPATVPRPYLRLTLFETLCKQFETNADRHPT